MYAGAPIEMAADRRCDVVLAVDRGCAVLPFDVPVTTGGSSAAGEAASWDEPVDAYHSPSVPSSTQQRCSVMRSAPKPDTCARPSGRKRADLQVSSGR